jgi:hypothetical protein
LQGLCVRLLIKTYGCIYVSAGFTDPFMVAALVAPQSYALKPGLHYYFSQHGLEYKIGFHIFQKYALAQLAGHLAIPLFKTIGCALQSFGQHQGAFEGIAEPFG